MDTNDRLTRSLLRFFTLLAALRNGPLERPVLLERLRDAYPQTASARPMLDRDVRDLRKLGITIEISRTRPPRYTLHGGTPVFNETGLRTLALIRDTFSERHPQAEQVRAVLALLTGGLSDSEREMYEQRQVQRVPLDPAIDYTPYAPLFTRLNAAIGRRQMLAFHYRPTGNPSPTFHPRVEPYDIEYRERHFYLVAYTSNSRQILDFRIDRIVQDSSFAELERLPPGMEHSPKSVVFRYRLVAALARGEISRRFDNQRLIERLPNGDVIIEAEGRSAFMIVRTLLRYAESAELLEPPELRTEMKAAVQRLAALYGAADEATDEATDLFKCTARTAIYGRL